MTPDDLAARGLRVKPLAWEKLARHFYRAPAPLFGTIRVENYGHGWSVAWSVPGYSDELVPGRFRSAANAKSAAEAHHAARVAEMIEATE
jgi:hypothetical protein